jgi:hypothetical protein
MTPSKEREFLAGLSYGKKELYLHVKENHFGKQLAITIPELYDELGDTWMELWLDVWKPDDLRRLCAEMPFCSCGKGVFYPATAGEVRTFHHWLKSRSLSLFERIRRVEDWHRELIEERQMELPI